MLSMEGSGMAGASELDLDLEFFEDWLLMMLDTRLR